MPSRVFKWSPNRSFFTSEEFSLCCSIFSSGTLSVGVQRLGISCSHRGGLLPAWWPFPRSRDNDAGPGRARVVHFIFNCTWRNVGAYSKWSLGGQSRGRALDSGSGVLGTVGNAKGCKAWGEARGKLVDGGGNPRPENIQVGGILRTGGYIGMKPLVFHLQQGNDLA